MNASTVPNLMDPMNLQNIPFQGYRIQGIDSRNFPYDIVNLGQYYLLLKPIAGLGYHEEQELWGHAFSTNETVENWRRTGKSLPQLEYIPTTFELIVSSNCGNIRASNTNLGYLDHHAPRINKIVEEVNKETLRLIKERNAVRDRIDQINATHFKKNQGG